MARVQMQDKHYRNAVHYKLARLQHHCGKYLSCTYAAGEQTLDDRSRISIREIIAKPQNVFTTQSELNTVD